MDYAVLLNFDARSSAKIADLIAQIATVSGNETNLLAGLPPHITLAVFTTEQPEAIDKTMREQILSCLQPFPLRFHSVGIFPGQQTVIFLAPSFDVELLEVHRQINSAIKPYCMSVSEYYQELNWVPHCTLGLELTPNELAAALPVLAHGFVTLDVIGVSLSLVECCPYCIQQTYAIRPGGSGCRALEVTDAPGTGPTPWELV